MRGLDLTSSEFVLDVLVRGESVVTLSREGGDLGAEGREGVLSSLTISVVRSALGFQLIGADLLRRALHH